MLTPITPPLWIDSDNALGSPSGDVDDGFALSALFKSGLKIEAVSSVFGNSQEPLVYRNLLQLGSLCGYQGKTLRGANSSNAGPSEASRFLAQREQPCRVIALGPLTNVAASLRENPRAVENINEIVFVGTNYRYSLPALRFFDFNHWNDPASLREVVRSLVPLTIIPCDVARRLRVTYADLKGIRGPTGEFIHAQSQRWFRRAMILKLSASIPVWDLVAAVFAIEPGLFHTVQTTLKVGRWGRAIYGERGCRDVKVVTGFEPGKIWAKFLSLF